MPPLWVAVSGLLVVLVLAGAALVVFRSTGAAHLSALAWRKVVNQTQRQPATWRDSPPPTSVALRVEVDRVIRPISSEIYGLAHATEDELLETGATVHRWGGNPNSRYNWEVGAAWNSARDWEFRNYGQDGDARSAPSQMADRFIATNQRLGISSVITVPALGWVARSGSHDLASVGVPSIGGAPFGETSTGAILGYDPTGNRQTTSIASYARKNAAFSDPPDVKDEAVFQDEWIAHLIGHFGSAAAGGVRYYAIDNEPDLWSFTHTDVHPVDPDYEEELASFLAYADAIKDVDPSAQILGPTLSGWNALFYSPRDRGTDAYRTHADRLAHGDSPFLPWWLQQVRAHDQRTGRRTLDVLDVHAYPQVSGVFAGATDEWSSRVRLRSTRSLWDPSYVDESWIADTVQLIPRLRAWIDQYYPGTRLAIGEWNWGADSTMNGALAISDVLGIFGREGVDLAAYWTSPKADTPGARAFAMYTNYDGFGSTFGDVALRATSTAPDDVAVYASRDSGTNDVVLMILNHRPDTPLATSIELPGFEATYAQVYRLDKNAPDIQYLGSEQVARGQLRVDLPAESISLFRVEAR
jgi:hypothetical protein